MFIAYDMKNGTEYAKIVKSIRNGEKVNKEYINLGRVLDKEKGIYKNRERGIFQYDIENDYYDDNPDWSGSSAPIEFSRESSGILKEKFILDFGDTFFLDSYIRKSKLMDVLDGIQCTNHDTVKAMICYYILANAANCHANTWYEGNYARCLYPKAKLTSQRISEFLSEFGSEETYRSFFRAYFPYISSGDANGENILIDSTGLPNNIHFPLTAISNHNGDINNEVRLIYVTQQSTGLPIYFRYCPGNIVDVTTLIKTIAELKQNGVNTKFAILDAGYYSKENARRLYKNNISFLTRLPETNGLYKELIRDHLSTLECRENFISYSDRYLYMKRVEIPDVIDGNRGYAYIGLDIARRSDESRKLFKRAGSAELSDDEVFNRMEKQGVFIILSSRKFAPNKILPTYYTRQQIEQVFDIGKNYADMLPLRVQTEKTFRGHLLLTFISCVILKMIQDKLLKTKYNPISLFMNLRNQKCKVYEDEIIPTEATKIMNNCYKVFKIDCPEVIT